MGDRICSGEGCSKPARKRGWCETHYRRWRLYGDPEACFRRQRGVCSVPDCGKPHSGHGYCHTHCERWKRTGDPIIPPVTYSTVHKLLAERRGTARLYPCAECGGVSAQWAYDHADPAELFDAKVECPYSLDLGHYQPMCVPCHKRFDLEYLAGG